MPNLRVILTVLTVALGAGPAAARQVLIVANGGNNTVGEYNAVTGAAINPAFINGQGLTGPFGLALDRSNHLFVSNSDASTIGQYDAITGATINATFVKSTQGLNGPTGLVVGGNNQLFVVNTAPFNPNPPTIGQYDATTGATVNASFASSGLNLPTAALLRGTQFLVSNFGNDTVGLYDATTGAAINPAFINGQGLNGPAGLVLDAANHLFVSNNSNNTVGEYDATTGATINSSFITAGQGLNNPSDLILDNANHLFVSSESGNTVGEYDAITGATINAAFIQGLSAPEGLIFVSPVPEPSSLLLIAGAAAAVGLRRRSPLHFATPARRG